MPLCQHPDPRGLAKLPAYIVYPHEPDSSCHSNGGGENGGLGSTAQLRRTFKSNDWSVAVQMDPSDDSSWLWELAGKDRAGHITGAETTATYSPVWEDPQDNLYAALVHPARKAGMEVEPFTLGMDDLCRHGPFALVEHRSRNGKLLGYRLPPSLFDDAEPTPQYLCESADGLPLVNPSRSHEDEDDNNDLIDNHGLHRHGGGSEAAAAQNDRTRETYERAGGSRAQRAKEAVARGSPRPKTHVSPKNDMALSWLYDDDRAQAFQFDGSRASPTTKSAPSTTNNTLAIPGVQMNSTHEVKKITISSAQVNVPSCILSFIFGKRLLTITKTISAKEAHEKAPIELMDESKTSTFELIARRAHKRKQGRAPGTHGFTEIKSSMDYFYVQTRGPNMPPCSHIDHFFQSIADFRGISVRKRIDRLELFSSEPHFFGSTKRNPAFLFFPAADCDVANEGDGNDGAGTIDQEYLVTWFLKMGMTKAVALGITAIQVRLFVPSKGIFKGMLDVTSEGSGRHWYSTKSSVFRNTPIQLDPTQMKVGPSPNPLKTAYGEDVGVMVITKTGFIPSANNISVQKLINGETLPDSCIDKLMMHHKPSFSHEAFMRKLGVPEDECKRYFEKRRIGSTERLHDQSLIGVSDSTGGQIPFDHIYVTGIANIWRQRNDRPKTTKIFVTRAPFLKVEHARVLEHLVERPDTMTVENWNFLQAQPVGKIYFALPRDGEPPLPSLIASGDLDGDRYWVCWDEVLIKEAKLAKSAADTAAAPTANTMEGAGAKQDSKSDNWFHETQQKIADMAESLDIQSLIGMLHSRATGKGIHFAFDEEERGLLADAYAHALDFPKHGKLIHLPTELLNKAVNRRGLYRFFHGGTEALKIKEAARPKRLQKRKSANPGSARASRRRSTAGGRERMRKRSRSKAPSARRASSINPRSLIRARKTAVRRTSTAAPPPQAQLETLHDAQMSDEKELQQAIAVDSPWDSETYRDAVDCCSDEGGDINSEEPYYCAYAFSAHEHDGSGNNIDEHDHDGDDGDDDDSSAASSLVEASAGVQEPPPVTWFERNRRCQLRGVMRQTRSQDSDKAKDHKADPEMIDLVSGDNEDCADATMEHGVTTTSEREDYLAQASGVDHFSQSTSVGGISRSSDCGGGSGGSDDVSGRGAHSSRTNIGSAHDGDKGNTNCGSEDGHAHGDAAVFFANGNAGRSNVDASENDGTNDDIDAGADQNIETCADHGDRVSEEIRLSMKPPAVTGDSDDGLPAPNDQSGWITPTICVEATGHDSPILMDDLDEEPSAEDVKKQRDSSQEQSCASIAAPSQKEGECSFPEPIGGPGLPTPNQPRQPTLVTFVSQATASIEISEKSDDCSTSTSSIGMRGNSIASDTTDGCGQTPDAAQPASRHDTSEHRRGYDASIYSW